MLDGKKVVLAVAHPSHELRLYGWLRQTHPTVCILTDGAGRSGAPRLPRSLQLIADAGASTGSICGATSDREVYAAILRGDHRLFATVASEIAAFLASEEIEAVVGDAAEGHNCTHDMWREMINAGICLAAKRSGRRILNFEFTLFGRPDECPLGSERAIWTRLDDELFARKLEAVRNYNDKLAAEVDDILGGALMLGTNRFSRPDLAAAAGAGIGLDAIRQFPELESRIAALVSGIELDSFRSECFWPATGGAEVGSIAGNPPFYELYGEKLVEAGVYAQAIRLHEHVLPVVSEMWSALGEARVAPGA
jgi:hypothetical protein